MSWLDWLQEQATNGREDALRALRTARRGRNEAKTLSAPARSLPPAPALEAQTQVTKQGTVIDKVSGHEIRDNGQGLHVATTDVGDDVILAMLNVGVERYGNILDAHGDDAFQLRIARVAGTHHLEVSFGDPTLERARLAAKAITPAPSNKAACAYIAERNSKRASMSDIPFHRLWQPTDSGQLNFVGLRLVGQQNLLLVSNGNETLVLPITHQQRQELAPQQRGIALTITSTVVIQAHTHGFER